MNDLDFIVKENYTVSVLYNNTTAYAVPDVNVVINTTAPFGWNEFLLILLSTLGVLLIGYLFLAIYHKWLIIKEEKEREKMKRNRSRAHHPKKG